MVVKEMEGKDGNLKEMMGFLEEMVCGMREEKVKLRHEIELMKRE